jgi:hypothetical protein
VRRALLALALAALPASAQERLRTHELLGNIGNRQAVLHLHANPRADGSTRLTGEYLLLPMLQRRYLEGERSKQLGVMFLREGATPILYGREPTATLQGTWNEGLFRGTRYGPGGQQRERFEFRESFPSMEGYSASVHCQVAQDRYAATLAFSVEAGRLRAGGLEWRSRVEPSGHGCVIDARERIEQASLEGGLRFVAGKHCQVTLRDLGDYVRVTAEDCAEFCGSQGYLEPTLVDRRGDCLLLRPR